MRTTAVFLALALAFATPAVADTIAASEAATHAGQFVTVEGVVGNVHASRSGTVFVDVGGRYPNQVFTAVVFKSDAPAVGDLTPLIGRKVAITGTVKLYQNRPEIVVTARTQITSAP